MIKPLQSLRFIAIVGVFLSHLLYLQSNNNYRRFFDRFLYDGYCGVTFFLILSGFVITYNYYHRINENSLKSSISFTLKRLKKLYPIHLLTFLIAIPLSYREILTTPFKAFIKAILNITLIQSFVPVKDIYFSYNGVAWYLSLTIFFYLVTPLLISFIKNMQSKNINLWFVIICIFIVQTLLVCLGRNYSNSHWLFYINPFFRVIDYFFGILLGVIILNKTKEGNVLLGIKSTLLEVASVVLFATAYYFYPQVNQVFRYGVYYIPFMILIIYVFSLQSGYISKFLSNKTFVYLGSISFEFYMIHQLVLRYVTIFMAVKYPIGTAVISLIIALCSSMFVHKFFTYYKIVEYKNRNLVSTQ